MDIRNRTAISTGAASGMGLLFAKNFAEGGGNVVMCDINESALKTCVDEINAKDGGRAIGVICDVRDYEQVKAACAKAVEQFGSLDVVANFAGGTAVRMLKVDRKKYPEFPDIPIEVYDWGLDVNLRAQMYFAHAACKYMREQKRGIVINIGSITGMEGSGYGVDYATAKSGAMFGLTKSIAQFGENYNIRCVCISPGPVLTRDAMATMRTLSKRAADPQEIIDLVMFVISDKGEFINGTNIMIDGGRDALGRKNY